MVILGKDQTKGNLSKKQINKKTDYYKSSQAKEKTKWNKPNQIKGNKNSFETSFKPTWNEIKIWSFGVICII